MRLTILYVPDCPNVATLQDRLAQVITADCAELALRLVDSQELAAELGMTGSPTLLIDGVDPFAEPGRSASLSCRLYRDEMDHLAGTPSLTQLRRALDLVPAPDAALADDENTGVEGERCAPTEDSSLPSTSLDEWRARTAPHDPACRAVHRAILRAFATTGRAPKLADLDQIATVHRMTAEKILADLHHADVIRLDPGGQISVAYPFSATPTRHRVQLASGVEVWAMCAVDALGMPAMLAVDAVISSSDPGNDRAVTVTVEHGHYTWDPPTAVVFLSASARDVPSADSCCNDLNFFTTHAGALAWTGARPQLHGEILDPATAQRLGQHIFSALLKMTQSDDPEAAQTMSDGKHDASPAAASHQRTARQAHVP